MDAGSSSGASGGNGARLVLIGSPDLISNNSLQQVPGNETLFLNLSANSKNAVLSDKQGVGTIVNDD